MSRDQGQDPIGEAFDTGHEIIVAVDNGHSLDESHNCDAMGCGQWHVIYRFTKPQSAQDNGFEVKP